MVRYILTRSLGLLLTLLLLSLVVFLLMHAIPGGPFDLEGGDKGVAVPKAVREAILAKYGLDQPLYVQYFKFLWRALHFDFGMSFSRPTETVTALIGRTWAVSFKLGMTAFLIALVLGLVLGVVAALYRNSWVDYVVTTIAVGGTVFPNFVVAVVLVSVFAVWLHWLPTSGWDGWRYWIMPVAAFSLLPMAHVARITRSSCLEVLREDYIRTARAKGLPGRVLVIHHMLRNAIIPIVTVLGQIFADVITGSFFIETIFRIPGLGRYFTTSIFERDYPMIMATALLLALLFGLINLLSDIIYAAADPRVRLGGEAVA
jgi:ABC-type dipeptide/oligopeptide/nickel transport system permease component